MDDLHENFYSGNSKEYFAQASAYYSSVIKLTLIHKIWQLKFISTE